MLADHDSNEHNRPLGIAVVIVNYRTAVLTVEAVCSVAQDPLVEEIVVVDNGSGDGSAESLRTSCLGPLVRVVESPVNLGFGQGVNLGAASCQAPLLFLLNSDAVVRPGALALLARALTCDATVGVVAPAVYRADGTTLQEPAYGQLPRPGAVLRARPKLPGRRPMSAMDSSPGWVSGVAMLLRRSDFVALGGFDPDFTMYLEDVDLCRRLLLIGKRAAREPAAAVVHLLGQSGLSRASRTAQFQRSKAIYMRKAGATPLQLLCASVLRSARIGCERLRASIFDRRATPGD